MDWSKEVRALLRVLIITAVIVGVYLAIDAWYNQLASPIEAQMAVKQLEDSPVTYATARAAATTRAIPNIAFWAALIAILSVWIQYGLRLLQTYSRKETTKSRPTA